MDHVGCMSCGHTAEVEDAFEHRHCPRCAGLMEPVSGDGAWSVLRQRSEVVRFRRATERRRLQLAQAARHRLA
jgi:hypothetical protein